MSRLIDADALSEWLKDYGQKVIKGERKISLMYVWKHIQDMQTNEERKTGKWIKKNKPLDLCTEWWYECSECGSKPPNDRYGHPNYLTDFCPNCGAKMNGGQTDE